MTCTNAVTKQMIGCFLCKNDEFDWWLLTSYFVTSLSVSLKCNLMRVRKSFNLTFLPTFFNQFSS